MVSAKAEPPTRTKPASAGCSFRKFQTRSVAGGSKGKSFLNVVENAFDGRSRSFYFAAFISLQCVPFLPQPDSPKLAGDCEQLGEARSQKCGANVDRIAGVAVRPDEAGMLLPKWIRRCAHGQKLPLFSIGSKALKSGARQCFRLFHQFVGAPFVVGGKRFVCGFSFQLTIHQVRMRGEIIETLAFEIGDRFKFVLRHERE